MTDASWVERAAVVALMLSSLAITWRRVSAVVETIRGARETPGFEIAPLGPRIRRFLWEVVPQGKGSSERPLAGLAHAFVFWGFCAFALVTVNHIASAFGGRFLSPSGAFGRFYFGLVAVWAGVVAVSIGGQFVRRFLVQPKWLGKVSPESGVIAGLIFVLMVTYLSGL